MSAFQPGRPVDTTVIGCTSDPFRLRVASADHRSRAEAVGPGCTGQSFGQRRALDQLEDEHAHGRLL